MTVFKTPALPRDVLIKGREGRNTVLARTARAVQSVPEVDDVPAQDQTGNNQGTETPAETPEAVAAVMYLADVTARLLEKIAALRALPLADFNARAEAYISETAATLPEETRQMFLNRADVYASAAAADIQAREQSESRQVNIESFDLLLKALETTAIQAMTLPDAVQTRTMATALADYKHALEGGEAAGFIAPGSGALMLADLRQDMALAAAEYNILTADDPTYLALLIASGETRLPEVDGLPEDTRIALLEKTLTPQKPEQEVA